MDNHEIESRLAELTRTVAKGQAAESHRADLMRTAREQDPDHWTQNRLAQHAGISQAAVSKTLRQQVGVDLHHHSDKPGWTLGRLLGVAAWTERHLHATGHQVTWERLLDKVIEGTTPPTPGQLDAIRKGVRADMQHLSLSARTAVGDALADIEQQTSEPLGADRLTQTKQMWCVLGMDTQKTALHRITA